MDTVSDFFSAVEVHIAGFTLESCGEFSIFEVRRTERLELAIRCHMVHQSDMEVIVDFHNVWNMELHCVGSRIEMIEPFIVPSLASTEQQKYFQYCDELTKTRWQFESLRLVGIKESKRT